MPTRERRARALGVPMEQLPDGRGKGPKVKGSAHYRWNPGRMLSGGGYVKVRVGCDHPLADPNGYAYEHLLVWCAAGNPKPADGEVLHHRNEDKQDNRVSNLQIITRSDHNSEHLRRRARDEKGRLLPVGTTFMDGREWSEVPNGRP